MFCLDFCWTFWLDLSHRFINACVALLFSFNHKIQMLVFGVLLHSMFQAMRRLAGVAVIPRLLSISWTSAQNQRQLTHLNVFIFYWNTKYTVPTNFWEQLFPHICRNSILFKILQKAERSICLGLVVAARKSRVGSKFSNLENF